MNIKILLEQPIVLLASSLVVVGMVGAGVNGTV
jgi:hypothetical protein